MTKSIITIEEISPILQKISLVKVQHPESNFLDMNTIFMINGCDIELKVNNQELLTRASCSTEVVCKFEHESFEYVLEGTIISFSSDFPPTYTVRIKKVQRFLNKRKYPRYDVDHNGYIVGQAGEKMPIKVKNISKGGLYACTGANMEIGNEVKTLVELGEGKTFTAVSRIVRKNAEKTGEFRYGMQFIEMTSEDVVTLEKSIDKLEQKNVEMSLHSVKSKDTGDKGIRRMESKVTFLGLDAATRGAIQKMLTNLGINDIEIFQNFVYHPEYFENAPPKLTVIDTAEYDGKVQEMVQSILDTFPKQHMILVLPAEYFGRGDLVPAETDYFRIIYKPIINDEFESMVIRLL